MSAAQAPSGSGTVYSVGGCTQYGVYVGNGTAYSVDPSYSVYRQTTATGYQLNIVQDYGCHLVSTKNVAVAASAHPAVAASGTSGSSAHNPGAVFPAIVTVKGPLDNPWVLGGLAALGILGIVGMVHLIDKHQSGT